MRNRSTRRSVVGALSAFALATLASAPAHAQQVDTNPPLPNVLLLLDNSGSMERMIDGNTPETDSNTQTASGTNACNCTDNGPGTAPTCNWTATAPAPNRWNTVQQALTGSLTNGYGCVAMPRTSGSTSTFGSEYSINGQAPYDVNYYMPYHRLVAQDPKATGASTANPAACVIAPGGLNGAPNGQGVGVSATGLGGNATDFTGTCASGVCSGSIVTREYAQLSNPVTCTFAQNNDGAITQMTDLMRFGLMTFDSDMGGGTGVTSGNQVNTTPFSGMWSYFPNWNSGATCPYSGSPVDCTSPDLMAVGARNPAAPPWEGRMVGFPTKYDITTQQTSNAEVEEVILGTRPYGGTPMAGMFLAAQNYLWNDPAGPNSAAVGVGDPFAKGGCRPEFIILLTDGAPNLDLQPSCSATPTGDASAGICPFPLPQTTAQTLYNNGSPTNGNPSIKTFAIGFAVSSFQNATTPVSCSQLAKGGTFSGACNCNDPTLPTYTYPAHCANPGTSGCANIGPCCVLECIAENGGTTQAYFADTPNDLTNALNAVLGTISANQTTRTPPAYSPVVSSSIASQTQTTVASSVYLSSMSPSYNKPWSGDIQRQEEQCQYNGSSYNVNPTIVASNGDDFAQNLNSNTGPARTFIAFQPAVEAGTSTVDSTATIRPYASSTIGDGMGAYSATMFAGPASTVIQNITPAAMGLTANCTYVSTVSGKTLQLTPQSLCVSMLLDFTFAQPTFGGGPSDFAFQSRYGNAFGDIFHATPIVVGPPGSLLQDPTYVAYSQAWGATSPTETSAWSTSTQGRKTAVYAATNDGLLHAFWAGETKLENNEMWAMVPPAVMPSIQYSYPASHEFLLDGKPIVKDTVYDRNSTASGASLWHTTLVAGFGKYATGYYAVDVTNPDPTGMPNGLVPSDSSQTGPVFLWQLTKVPTGNYPLFASQSATPTITTMYFDPGDGQGARDIGVAILPGGQNGPPTSSLPSGPSCARVAKSTDSAPVNSYTARSAVRCWGASNPPKSTDSVTGRSVSIVRLDTGEVIRSFVRLADVQANYPADTMLAKSRYVDAQLDSPMTGTPLVFPTDVGADTTKFFVGDADGTLWKFDVSNPLPANWTGQLFLDLYNTTVDTATTTSWGDGQPFDVDPVLSLNTSGQLVINAATGSIQQFDSTGTEYVYSITEQVQGAPAKLRANVNWWLGPAGNQTVGSTQTNFQAGERVSGPMLVFNGVLYFSTYVAPAATSATCTSGQAFLYGMDFVNPYSGGTGEGGVRMLAPPPPAAQPAPNAYPFNVTPTTPAGAVIPGVSILATPACSGLGAATSDPYVAGATHQMPQNFTAGGFSLFTQVGAKGNTGISATQQFQMNLPPPASPTTIDSWAAVLE